jgi:glycerol-3-phosphate cytidylyltransferase-like family protein
MKAKNITILIVGIVSDFDSTLYKRIPIINEIDRVEIIKNIKIVDKVIFPCPLIVDMNFIKEHNIDMVVHGFCNENDREKQKDFYAEIKKNGYFQEIE